MIIDFLYVAMVFAVLVGVIAALKIAGHTGNAIFCKLNREARDECECEALWFGFSEDEKKSAYAEADLVRLGKP